MDPATGEPYATRFPILTMEDMVRAQFAMLDALGIEKLYASVGASMGGMQSLAAGVLFPSRVGRIATISGCARSHPYSIAMRHTQRQVLMMDPNWNRGFYYGAGRVPPHVGMKLARQIATVTYRSGPEWEQRFARRRADPRQPPALCPDFLIETYLDHAGEKFSLEYDANSLLYVSKAMDLFDLGQSQQDATRQRREDNMAKLSQPQRGGSGAVGESMACSLTLPETPYEEQPPAPSSSSSSSSAASSIFPTSSASSFSSATSPFSPSAQSPSSLPSPPADLVSGLAALHAHPTLVLGVASDILFPAWQQREIADTLRAAGNAQVTHVELGEDKSLFGHDTFLLDLENVGGSLKEFLS